MIKNVIVLSICAVYAIGANISDNENKTKLNTTVVTATGFESPLKDETKNVFVITSQEIQDHGFSSVREVLQQSPSITFYGANQQIDLRGQGIKSSTSVKVLLNGISMNMIDSAHGTIPLDSINVDDIDRIEIIPGGGSVLYGGGTAGGVVNIITKQNPQDFASISGKIGSYSHRSTNLLVGKKLNDRLFVKFNVNAFNQKGYRYDEKDRGYYTSGSTIFKIDDYQTITLNGSYYDAKVDDSGGISKNELEKNRRASGVLEGTQRRIKIDGSLDYSIKTNNNLEFNLMPFYARTELKKKDSLFADSKRGISTKVRYSYDNSEIIAGYDYELNNGYRYLKVPNVMVTDIGLKKQTNSVYLLSKYNFTDYFLLSTGSRFERANYETTRKITFSIPGATNTNVKSKRNLNNYSFELAPNFKYSDTGSAYFKFERGYISPSPTQFVDKLPNGINTNVGGRTIYGTYYTTNDLKSETFNTYEFGVRDLIFNQYASATVYLSDTDNEILNVSLLPGHGTAWKYINIDKTRRYGLELYSEQFLFDNLKLSQTFSYINSKIKKGENAGKKVPYVPNAKIVLGVDYSPRSNINLLTDLKYVGSSYNPNYEKNKSTFIVDSAIKFSATKNFSIIAGIKNLFNEKYNLEQSVSSDSYVPAPERNYYAEFKYKF